MSTYVALLRGIGPGNPSMRNENLRAVCEGLGFGNVSTVISSGNVIFDTDSSDAAALEATLEDAWMRDLGFESTTIVRNGAHLKRLVELEPFEALEHGRETYLLVTFSKGPLSVAFDLPHQPANAFRVVSATEKELFTVSDTTRGRTPEVMAWVETEFGKELTSRTWLTVARILKRME